MSQPEKPERKPLCVCGKGIRPCAPCCRHTGWVHRVTGDHDCGRPHPDGQQARPGSGTFVA